MILTDKLQTQLGLKRTPKCNNKSTSKDDLDTIMARTFPSKPKTLHLAGGSRHYNNTAG